MRTRVDCGSTEDHALLILFYVFMRSTGISATMRSGLAALFREGDLLVEDKKITITRPLIPQADKPPETP